MFRPIGRVGAAFAIVLSLAASGWAAVSRPRLDKALTDAEFWHLVTSLSEEGGRFPRQLMSNEDSLQFVVPELARTVRPGGVYLGVGSEQNFTYFATLRPKLAFVVDIRRDNLLEMLMYQALFESSNDRADFISRLFSRPRPVRVKPNSTAAELFAAFANQQPDQALTELTANAVIDRLLHTHGFALPEADQAGIRRMLDQFRLYRSRRLQWKPWPSSQPSRPARPAAPRSPPPRRSGPARGPGPRLMMARTMEVSCGIGAEAVDEGAGRS